MAQNEHVLVRDALHVRVHPHRTVLCSVLAAPQPLRPVLPHWQLSLGSPVFPGSFIPDYRGCFDDVRTDTQDIRGESSDFDSAAYVQGRNIFNSNNMIATLGRMAFGFVWGAMACLLLATVFFCVGGAMSKRDSSSGFGRKKSTRSRGSFLDTNDASR